MQKALAYGAFGLSEIGIAGVGLKNRIINGDFRISQRGASFSVPVISNAGQFFRILDRFTISDAASSGGSTSGLTISQQSFTPGQTDVPGSPRFFCRIQNANNNNPGSLGYSILNQSIEDVAVLGGQTVSISFYAKSSIANKRIGVELIQSFGTGGSTSSVLGIGSQSFVLTSNWQLITVTCAVPSISGKTLGTPGTDFTGLNIWLTSGGGVYASGNDYGARAGYSGGFGWGGTGTIDIANVQIEIAANPTSFEIIDTTLSLLRCLRYCWQSNSENLGIIFNGTNTYSFGKISFPVAMRAAPTLLNSSFNLSGVGAVGTPTIGYATNFGAAITNSANNWGSYVGYGAFLIGTFDAEL